MTIPDGKFTKKEHLLKTKDFSKVYKKGIFRKTDGIVFYCMPNALEHNRLGFSISSRFVKRATARNRMRRLFREAYRKNKRKIIAGNDIVLVFRKDLSDKLEYDTAESILLKLAKQLDVAA